MIELKGRPGAAFHTSWPWLMLGTVCAASMAFVDRLGPVIALIIAALAALAESGWAWVRLRRNRVVVTDGEVRLIRGNGIVDRGRISDGVRVVVESSDAGWMQYVSAAYTSFARVRIVGSGAGIEMLVIGRRQIRSLQDQVDRALRP